MRAQEREGERKRIADDWRSLSPEGVGETHVNEINCAAEESRIFLRALTSDPLPS